MNNVNTAVLKKKPRRKARKDSLVEFNKKYANNPKACYDFFFNIKYPKGYVCEKCGCKTYKEIKRHHVCECTSCHHQQYLFSNTIFQDNKLDLYKLLLGLFLFFTANKGISAMELRSRLGVNYKTASLLVRKCRWLMREENEKSKLKSAFYEADVIFIGGKSKEENCQGKASTKQQTLIVLSTDKENEYPDKVKLDLIKNDTQEVMDEKMPKMIELGTNRVLNSDGTQSFNHLSKIIIVRNDKINYKKKDHKLYWLNIIISNIKNNISGIYHGLKKRILPLFVAEQEYRYNSRNYGKTFMLAIASYIKNSKPHTCRMIKDYLDDLEPTFNKAYA